MLEESMEFFSNSTGQNSLLKSVDDVTIIA